MIRDYEIVSPSLEGVLEHASMDYGGIRRPLEVLRALDGPASRGSRTGADGGLAPQSEHEQRVLEQYFHDLYGVFMKKLSFFVVESDLQSSDTVKLQAMLQELIKIKGLMRGGEK